MPILSATLTCNATQVRHKLPTAILRLVCLTPRSNIMGLNFGFTSHTFAETSTIMKGSLALHTQPLGLGIQEVKALEPFTIVF